MSFGNLYYVPLEVLDYILSLMSSLTLARLSVASKAFRAKVDKVARDRLFALSGSEELAVRCWTRFPKMKNKLSKSKFNEILGVAEAEPLPDLNNIVVDPNFRRYCTWLERLRIEETETMFDVKRCENQGIKFVHVEKTRVTVVKLEDDGPKLLLSDVTTADVPLLRWRMKVKSNVNLEFGIVPAAVQVGKSHKIESHKSIFILFVVIDNNLYPPHRIAQDKPKALHVCSAASDDGDVRPSGFCSSTTIGSKLAVKLPLMHGSIVEIVVSKDVLRYMVIHPVNGVEIIRDHQNGVITKKKRYTGSCEFRFEQDILPDQPFKLAITLWRDCVLQVLHVATDEGRRVLGGFCASEGPANNP